MGPRGPVHATSHRKMAVDDIQKHLQVSTVLACEMSTVLAVPVHSRHETGKERGMRKLRTSEQSHQSDPSDQPDQSDQSESHECGKPWLP